MVEKVGVDVGDWWVRQSKAGNMERFYSKSSFFSEK